MAIKIPLTMTLFVAEGDSASGALDANRPAPIIVIVEAAGAWSSNYLKNFSGRQGALLT
jgi:hypothetical protein